ncbi:Flp family type IVb pilin [Sphingomonas oryzagri]
MFRKLIGRVKPETVIEYGLIAALIAVAGLTAFSAMEDNAGDRSSNVAAAGSRTTG